MLLVYYISVDPFQILNQFMIYPFKLAYIFKLRENQGTETEQLHYRFSLMNQTWWVWATVRISENKDKPAATWKYSLIICLTHYGPDFHNLKYKVTGGPSSGTQRNKAGQGAKRTNRGMIGRSNSVPVKAQSRYCMSLLQLSQTMPNLRPDRFQWALLLQVEERKWTMHQKGGSTRSRQMSGESVEIATFAITFFPTQMLMLCIKIYVEFGESLILTLCNCVYCFA